MSMAQTTPRRSNTIIAARRLTTPTRDIVRKALLGHVYKLFDDISSLISSKLNSLTASSIAATDENETVKDYLLVYRTHKLDHSHIGPHDALRLFIDVSGNHKVLVYNKSVEEGTVSSTDVSPILEKLNNQEWIVCRGVQQYGMYKASIGYDIASVEVTEYPPDTARHKECLLWFQKNNKKSQVCAKCLSLKWKLTERKKTHDGYTADHCLKCQHASSTVPIDSLSPCSKKAKVENLRKEVHTVRRQVSNLESKIEHVCVEETQSNEISEIVRSINNCDVGQRSLNKIYREAEESGHGRGELLKKAWERDIMDMEIFQSDQAANSK